MALVGGIMREAMRVYYFGRWNQPGHYLYNEDGRTCIISPIKDLNWMELDNNDKVRLPGGPTHLHGQLRWPPDEPLGKTVLIHREGWTILGMWDRSGDNRYHSRSLFLAEGQLTETEMWTLAEKHFPELVKRIKGAA